jgi:benzoate/toluate 1,2-dioxygenase reductase subunit
MPNIALNFEDGLTRIIKSTGNETVAETAYRLGINIPLDCADGACGTCKCKHVSGAFDAGEYIEDALSDEEFANGFALACQMRPKTDLVIDILASSAACKVKAGTQPSVLMGLKPLSAEVFSLVLRPQTDTPLDFLPGQYANIEIPGTGGITRSYSFSSRPGSVDLEFLIRTIPNGLMSTYLKNEAKLGDVLNLTGAIGAFYARDIKRPTLFFAGGTGIAPFLAMLEHICTGNLNHPVRLYYGVTNEENLVETGRLDAFAQHQNFEYYPCVSHQTSGKYAGGYVTQWINSHHLGDGEFDIYICGPNAMVDAVKDLLEAEHIAVVNFYTEKFIPTGNLSAV